MRAINLDISKGFDMPSYWRILHKLPSNGISGRDFSVIKCFLNGRSVKIVFNSQSSKAHQMFLKVLFSVMPSLCY